MAKAIQVIVKDGRLVPLEDIELVENEELTVVVDVTAPVNREEIARLTEQNPFRLAEWVMNLEVLNEYHRDLNAKLRLRLRELTLQINGK